MQRLRIPIILILMVAIAAGATFFILKHNTSSHSIEIILPPPSCEIEVYVSGEVKFPGNYILDEGARVTDAIEAAGGFTPEADHSAINMAGALRNEAHVNVYRIGEASQRININTAEAWLLDALPGIGEATAQAIIEYRTENGQFEEIADLKNIKGIGDSTFEKLQDKVTVY